MTQNKLKQLLLVKPHLAKRKSASGSIDGLMILMSISYIAVLVLVLAFQDLLIYGPSEPCPSITKPFGECNKILRAD